MDLLDVLKMHGAQKQLRQVLTSLKKDKLIKRYVLVYAHAHVQYMYMYMTYTKLCQLCVCCYLWSYE